MNKMSSKRRVVDRVLYEKVLKEARKKFKRFPSIYASSWIVSQYKKRGGTYEGKKPVKNRSGLSRWYKEQWIQVIPFLKSGKKIICGANNKDGKACRPLIRKTKGTPITLLELKKIHSVAKLVGLAKKKEKDMKGRVSWKKGTFRRSKKAFLYNPEDPAKSFDVYIDKRPEDTIPIKYTTVEDVKKTINKLERLYREKKYSHKRIWQVGMIMYVRLKVLKAKKKAQFLLSKRYFAFLGKRSKIKRADKKAEFKMRKSLKFKV